MKSKYFAIHELVPKSMYEAVSDEKLWNLVPEKLVETIDAIKEKFPNGAMLINNYYWGGNREWSGLRVEGCPYYNTTSQHTIFNAIDAIFTKYDVEEVRQYIIDNPQEFPHVKGIELDVGWLHVDCRDREYVLQFKA